MRYIIVALLLALSTNAYSQKLYTSVSASESMNYADFGYSFSSNSSLFVSASFNKQIDNYAGIGYSYLPVIYEKLNIISGFDAKALMYQGLQPGFAFQFKNGVRIGSFDITAGVEAEYGPSKLLNKSILVDPKIQVAFRF